MKLRLLAIALSTLTPLACFVAYAGQDPQYEVVEVRDGVHVIRGAGANTVVLETGDELLVVDSKFARHGGALRRAIESIRAAPIRWLINSHHHAENCDGNRALPTEATRIVAHDNADRRMREDSRRGADVRFKSRLTLQVGDETVTCHHKGAAHTDGDTLVHFHDARVLVAGGLIAVERHPAAATEDGTDLRGWIRALVELERDFRDDELIVIPGDGEHGGRALITNQLAYLREVLDYMEDAQRHGLTQQEALRNADLLRTKFVDYGGDHFEAMLRLAYQVAGR